MLRKAKRTLKSVLRAISGKGSTHWSEIEYFNPEWKNRIKKMAQYIGDTESVVDLGCGEMWLREFLTPQNTYTGVDYAQRNGDMLVCDFNAGQYPGVKADVYFVSGCLEYVDDYAALIDQIVAHCRTCIISYCCIEDFSDLALRRQRAWVNDLNRQQLIDVFADRGMQLDTENKTLTNNSIFVFRSKQDT